MWEIGVLLVLIGAVVVVAAPWLMRRMPRGETVAGTLLVTGVSPRPDATGEQFVTVTGVINGPGVDEHTVYQRYTIDVGQWPTVGDLIPVVYSPKNPDNWAFAPTPGPAQ